MGGETRATSGDGALVTLSATPSQRGVVAGVANRIHVMAELATGKDETRIRPDYELAILLDKSGSMSGSKLTGAKKAISHVIDSLGERDLLHLIAYDSTVDTVFSHANPVARKDELQQLVQKVRAGSSTNMGISIERAMQLFDTPAPDAAGGGPRRTKRVFLFSDGCVNEGAKSDDLVRMISDLFASGAQTSSFGIGADYDATLMKAIAEHGNGDYCFLDREKHIHKYVNRALRSMLGTIGTSARLTARGRNGAIVRAILGHEDAVRGADIGDIREENIKQILFDVEVVAADVSATPVVDFTLTYRQSRDVLAPFATIEISLPLTVFDDSAVALAAEAEEQVRVAVALAIFRASEEDERVLALLSANKVDEAISTKQALVTKLAQLSERDTTGFIEACVHRGRKTVSKMMSRISVPQMLKSVDYECEMERALSACSIGQNSDSGSCGSEGGAPAGGAGAAGGGLFRVHSGGSVGSVSSSASGSSGRGSPNIFNHSPPHNHSKYASNLSNADDDSDTDDDDEDANSVVSERLARMAS